MPLISFEKILKILEVILSVLKMAVGTFVPQAPEEDDPE